MILKQMVDFRLVFFLYCRGCKNVVLIFSKEMAKTPSGYSHNIQFEIFRSIVSNIQRKQQKTC